MAKSHSLLQDWTAVGEKSSFAFKLCFLLSVMISSLYLRFSKVFKSATMQNSKCSLLLNRRPSSRLHSHACSLSWGRSSHWERQFSHMHGVPQTGLVKLPCIRTSRLAFMKLQTHRWGIFTRCVGEREREEGEGGEMQGAVNLSTSCFRSSLKRFRALYPRMDIDGLWCGPACLGEL